LDQRIVNILRPDAEQLSSAALMALIGEVDKAIEAADREGRAARASALDPSLVDAGARGRAEDSEFLAARYRAGLAKLRELHAATVKREEKERWSAEAAPIRQRITDLAKELVTVYPAAVSQLITLFKKIAATDQEARSLNFYMPPGASPLGTVEGRIGRGEKIVEKVVLPMLTANGVKNIWPPQVNIGLEYSEMIAQAMRGAPPAPTEAERIAEAERHILAGQAREREKERIAAAGGR
jgi:hypothetical protein